MIRIENLSYGYSSLRTVLKDISVQFEPGHVYGLLGSNGVGKSTLIKLMCGLLRGQGSISVDGFDPRMRDINMLRQIRLVPETEALPRLSAEQWARLQAPFYPDFDFEALHAIMQELEVDGKAKLTDMSMGQRKKAVIAVALACNTPYLFMDEPTNGLDIPSKSAFRRLIAQHISAERTIIISTHQVDDLENVIDAVTILDNDSVLLNTTLDEIGRRLTFGVADEGDRIIYSEPTLHGEMAVMENKSGVEMPVDIKLFFTATVKNKQEIQQLFA